MHQAVAHHADVIITQGRHAVREAGLDDASVDMNEASGPSRTPKPGAAGATARSPS